MSHRNCVSCGVDISSEHGNRVRCGRCSPKRDWSKYPKTSTYVPVATRLITCRCGVEFEARGPQRYCSKSCVNAKREDRRKFPCSSCGQPMWNSRSKAATPVCHGCRPQHGVNGYKRRGCRCEVCKAAVAEAAREYRARFREREGVSVSSKRTTTTYYWITPAKRQAIYERDGWVCQLCSEPVDRTLDSCHRFAATLDHIECQSWALIPDHSPENLRLAHRACNSRRRDRTDEPVRVA